MPGRTHTTVPMDRRTALLALGAASALAACGGGGSSEPPTEPVGQVFSSTLKSESNGYTYAIQVYVPQSYATGTTALPVIYATEGDALYGSGVTPTRFDTFKQAMQTRGTQAILVGIGGTVVRGTDFLLPGATRYLNFITKELVPVIERQYRADPKRRALSGLSHGGYFVIAALVTEGLAGAPSFSHYLSTEASYGGHGSTAAFLSYEKQLDGKPLPTTLYLTGAGTGTNNVGIIKPLYEQMRAQNNPGFTLVNADYNASHVGTDLPAFEDALKRFFP